MKKYFKISLAKQSTAAAQWNKIKAALATPSPDGTISFRAFVSAKKRPNGWFLATLDSSGKEVLFARITSWVDDAGNALSDEEQAEVALGKNSVTDCILGDTNGTAELMLEYDDSVVSSKGGIEKVKLIPEIEEKAEKMAAEEGCLLSKEDILERVWHMIAGGVPQQFVLFLMDDIRTDRPSEKMPTPYVDPDLEKTLKKGEPTLLYRALQSFEMGYSRILKGPKSTGKNTFINWICYLMNVPQTEHTATLQDSRSEYMATEVTDNTAVETLRHMKAELLAKKLIIMVKVALMEVVNIITFGKVNLELTDDDKEALATLFLYDQAKAEAASVHIVYEYAAMAKWLMQGGVFVLNEANMADANLLVGLLHPILDGSITSFPVPGVGDVPLGKNLVLYMTMNPGYVGEQDMNEATVSRLGAFNLSQPKNIRGVLEKAVEHEMAEYGVTQPLDSIVFEQAVNFYDTVNEAVYDGDRDISDQALNIRGMVRAMATYGRYRDIPGVTLKSLLRDEVVTPCDDTEAMALENVLNATIHC